MKLKNKSSFKNNLLLSLACHALLTAIIYLAPKEFFQVETPNVVQIDFVSAQPNTTPKKPMIEEKKSEQKQVVEQDERQINDEISDTKFLSAHNQVVKKQTVAVNHGDFRNTKVKSTKSGDGGQKASPLTLEDLKPKFDIQKTIEHKVAQEQILEKQFEEDAIKKFQAKTESKKQPAQAAKPGESGAEASQTIDYIKNLDPGLETLLSTKEFVYYTYYSRIRRQLNQHWGGMVREKLTKIFQQGRSIASNDDKVTKLLITLDPSGKLVKTQVIGDSGIHDLDEAAVEAFRAAAPFPNPPPGIVDSDGVIKIRWDFILEA